MSITYWFYVDYMLILGQAGMQPPCVWSAQSTAPTRYTKSNKIIDASAYSGLMGGSQFEGFSLSSYRLGSSFSRCAPAATSASFMRNTTPPVRLRVGGIT
jgi:hypothetical protein